MNQSDYEPDYIFAYQIQPERLATWKRTAEWYVSSVGTPARDTHRIKVPWLKYKQRDKKQPRNKAYHKSRLCVGYEEIEYMRQQLDQLIFSKDISLSCIAEMAGISKTSLYDMYNIDRQHVRNRRTMFNKLYQAFWEIKPFNRQRQSPKQREIMWYEV